MICSAKVLRRDIICVSVTLRRISGNVGNSTRALTSFAICVAGNVLIILVRSSVLSSGNIFEYICKICIIVFVYVLIFVVFRALLVRCFFLNDRNDVYFFLRFY